MTDNKEKRSFEQLVRRLDPQCRLLRSWSLAGGVSAEVTALELLRPDGENWRVVVRQHGEGNLRQNPNIASNEFRLLKILQSAGVAAPIPIFLDALGETLSTTAIVVGFIEGEPEFSPPDLDDFLFQSAAHLAKIHRIDGAYFDLSFLPRQIRGWGERSAVLDESLAEGCIRAALESRWPPVQTNEAVLLHGDYWPGNLLWTDGRLAAVIDWEDAVVGDPLADVANGRLEILWALGMDAMHKFTDHYKTLMPSIDFANLPYWDLCAALRPASKLSTWGLDVATENHMRAAHQLFIEQAFGSLL
jgi:aminoglycoside phosphotransferase (APT) family kinase protein